MKVILENVVYAGSGNRKDGKVVLTFVEDSKIRKVTANSVKNGVPVGSVVNAEIENVSSIFANYGDLNLNSEFVEVVEA